MPSIFILSYWYLCQHIVTLLIKCLLISRFNHKTGAEDVHFTSTSSHLTPENDEEDSLKNDVYEYVGNTEDNLVSEEYENSGSAKQSTLNVLSTEGSSSVTSTFGDDPTVLEMIMVKDVKSGIEVAILLIFLSFFFFSFFMVEISCSNP